MRHAAIDEIVFQFAALGQQSPTTSPSLSVHLPVADGKKGFSHRVPLFARRPPIAPNEPYWQAYCGLLKTFGIPLQTTVASLEKLSVANVPLRLAKRDLDEGFESLELETAEAIEICCVATTPGGLLPQLPSETAAWHELKVLVRSVRELSGGATPIGLGMLVGDIRSDVANALASSADFVILQFAHASQELSPAELDLLVWSVAEARRVCKEAGVAQYPVYVDAAITRSDDIVKLLALGASAIAIDALTATCMGSLQRGPHVSQGMLGGLGSLSTQSVPLLRPLENKLAELVETLKTRLRQLQVADIGQLSADHLRALSEQAASLSGVRVLSR